MNKAIPAVVAGVFGILIAITIAWLAVYEWRSLCSQSVSA